MNPYLPASDSVVCEQCGAPMEFIPYQDQAGCGSAIIELWRCPNGHVEYGNTIGEITCDVAPAGSDD